MTRILVQRGSPGSSSNSNHSPQITAPQVASASKEEDQDNDVQQETCALDDLLEHCGSSEDKTSKNDELLSESNQSISNELGENDKAPDSGTSIKELGRLCISERLDVEDTEGMDAVSSEIATGSSYLPPPPPVPPPKPCATEAEGYNSADEQNSCFGSSYDNADRERFFELDIRRTKGLEVRRMVEDGNCLFRAVADQVYGDPEAYDMARQLCIDYMERERDHFSQFITEGFTSYCKRKRRDKVYGNNTEIQAFSEMYNRPIHIYSYTTEPINIFHGSYNTDTPPIRLSYHHRNHYNSLVDPRRLTIGAGLGFSSLQGTNIDKDQVKAAIKAQQDRQIDNALLAEGQFYSDLELTEKEIEQMVMEASRAEYLAEDKFKQQLGFRESSTSGAEPSSSGARPSQSESKLEDGREKALPDTVLSSSVQILLSMGFSYLQVIGAYSIFGDDVDSMVYYLLEMEGSGASPGNEENHRKGKAAE